MARTFDASGKMASKLANYWPQLKTLSRRAHRLMVNTGGILRSAIDRFTELCAAQAAAGLAFYAIFALFPLLLFLVAVSSFVFEEQRALQEVTALVTRFFPTAQNLVIQNLQLVFRLRGTVSFIAAISLLWSASSFFMILEQQVNLAWRKAPSRTAWGRRLLALGMVAGLAGLLILWFILNTALTFIWRLELPLREALEALGPLIRTAFSQVLSWVLPFSFGFFLYRFIPNTRITRSEAFWGALVTTFSWKAATTGFVWYLASGLSRYHLVYGSLGSMVALMFWIYLSNILLLFGAHVSAAISRHALLNRLTAEGSSEPGLTDSSPGEGISTTTKGNAGPSPP